MLRQWQKLRCSAPQSAEKHSLQTADYIPLHLAREPKVKETSLTFTATLNSPAHPLKRAPVMAHSAKCAAHLGFPRALA